MLQEALLRGQVSRGEIIRSSGMAERTGRILLGQLLDEGLLLSDSPKEASKQSISVAYSTDQIDTNRPQTYTFKKIVRLPI